VQSDRASSASGRIADTVASGCSLDDEAVVDGACGRLPVLMMRSHRAHRI